MADENPVILHMLLLGVHTQQQVEFSSCIKSSVLAGRSRIIVLSESRILLSRIRESRIVFIVKKQYHFAKFLEKNLLLWERRLLLSGIREKWTFLAIDASTTHIAAEWFQVKLPKEVQPCHGRAPIQ